MWSYFQVSWKSINTYSQPPTTTPCNPPRKEEVMRRYIPDSPGLSRPAHMDDVEWQEYMMTDEARHELTREPDYDYYSDPTDDDYADFVAEQEAERMEEVRNEAEEVSLEELEEAHRIIGEEIDRRREQQ